MENYDFNQNRCCRQKHHPPFLRSTNAVTPKHRMYKLEVLTQLSTRTTLPRISPGFRAINTLVTYVGTHENPILMY